MLVKYRCKIPVGTKGQWDMWFTKTNPVFSYV